MLMPIRDKTTISYTAIMGLREDTHLHGQDYSNVAMMFYIGYIFAEFPTQYFAQRISRLAKYLSANVMLCAYPFSDIHLPALTQFRGSSACMHGRG